MALLARFLYPPIYSLLILAYAPLHIYRILWRRKGPLSSLLDRLGKLPLTLLAPSEWEGPRIWLHAASVGEVTSIRALVDQLFERPVKIFISTTSETGQQVAKDLYGEQATIFFFPLDWKWVYRRYLRIISPDLVLLTETELWPSFITSLTEHNIPLALINGRISNRSLSRYRRIKFFLKPLLQTFCELGMQSQEDKNRILQIGAPEKKTCSTGNLKFDYSLPPNTEAKHLVDTLGSIFRKDKGGLVWVAGSTREGEEKILAPIFLSLRKRFGDLHWLIAPRHIERSSQVVKILKHHGISSRLRSQIGDYDSSDPPEAIVLDSIGELAHTFQVADVVFIGGSLVPWGGHNVIEAAYFSKAILFGPHMHNFREIKDLFLNARSALQAASPKELEGMLFELLENPENRVLLGHNARAVLGRNQGALQQTLDLIDRCLTYSRKTPTSP